MTDCRKGLFQLFVFASAAAAVCLCAAGLPQRAAGAEAEEPRVQALTGLLEATLENHEAIGIAEEALNQARFRKKRFLMTLTPDVAFQGWNRRVYLPGENDEDVSAAGLPEGSYYGYALTVTQPLYTGGRATAAYRGAGNVEQSLLLQSEIVRRDLILAAAESYYRVLAAAETVRTGEQAVSRALRHLQRAEKLLELGETTRSDQLRAEVNLAQVENDLILRRNELAKARELAERLAARSLAHSPAVPPTIPEPELSRDELVANALEKRRERKQDRLAVLTAGEDVKEKKGRFLPALSLVGSYASSGPEPGDQSGGWEAGVFLDIPIYQRGARFFHLRESRSALTQAELMENRRERDIALEVNSLYHDLQAAAGLIRSLASQLDLAKENLRLAEKRFEVGLADSLDVVDAQTALVRAEVGLTEVTYGYEIAKLRLHRSAGSDLLDVVRLAGR